MKIVVIGGSGLIGSRVVGLLRQQGHQVTSASPASGVNTLTREGLAKALDGAEVVVDVANSPSFEKEAALQFFQTAGRNLLAAEVAAGVGHHLALSVVGTERLQDSGYFVAKLAQEKLIKASAIPWTILRATQFFEFIPAIIESGADGDLIRLPPALIQPVAADDVAATLADLAAAAPLNGTVELAGPAPLYFDAMAEQVMAARGDTRRVIADIHASYFGTRVNDQSLTPGASPRLGATTLTQWLRQHPAKG